MIKELENAISIVSMLSETDQKRIAEMILFEIEDDKKWKKQFAGSQNELAILANEALEEYKSGKTKIMKFE